MAALGAAGVAPIPFLLAPGLDANILDLQPGGSGIKTYNQAIKGLDVQSFIRMIEKIEISS